MIDDPLLPNYFATLTRLLPDHIKRNQRIMLLLATSHDDMLEGEDAVVMLKVYRRFMQAMLADNPDPMLTERIRDAFVIAVREEGASLGSASTDGFQEKQNT